MLVSNLEEAKQIMSWEGMDIIQNAKGITKIFLCVLQFFKSGQICWLCAVFFFKIEIKKVTQVNSLTDY